ncbi:hypothetical protein KP509_34G045200 [Ceratopteris richardii]|uniref:Uncharacterized protein n=1 Tax=Ceratopteris richardii TaxID=49495 RepID=A0A8T2QJE0_CERRI|nr:hypothetical protein KP509_34G045200 [Ceratopteris richardii]
MVSIRRRRNLGLTGKPKILSEISSQHAPQEQAQHTKIEAAEEYVSMERIVEKSDQYHEQNLDKSINILSEISESNSSQNSKGSAKVGHSTKVGWSPLMQPTLR